MKYEIFSVTNNLGQPKGLSPSADPTGLVRKRRPGTIFPEELLATCKFGGWDFVQNSHPLIFD